MGSSDLFSLQLSSSSGHYCFAHSDSALKYEFLVPTPLQLRSFPKMFAPGQLQLFLYANTLTPTPLRLRSDSFATSLLKNSFSEYALSWPSAMMLHPRASPRAPHTFLCHLFVGSLFRCSFLTTTRGIYTIV